MNIHEYQAKKLFERFNVATPKGAPAETPEEGERVAAGLNTSNLVVKAQIHAGGRGKGDPRSVRNSGLPDDHRLGSRWEFNLHP
jgi:succinyl-CoA synthetase beta subunit